MQGRVIISTTLYKEVIFTMGKMIFVAGIAASLLLSVAITATALESESAAFRPSPNSTPSLNPSVSYHVYDERYNPFVAEIDEAVRNVLKYNWMLPSPLVIELGKPSYECPQEAIAYFCLDGGRGYSYINFMPASLNQGITQRYNTYYHELGHAAAEATGLFLGGDPCIDQNHYGQWQPWTCQWNEGFAEFFSANFMRRTQSVYPTESNQSPSFIANTMLQWVAEIGWNFFLCIYDKARTAILGGYWTRYEWELAMQKCSSPLLEVSLFLPGAVWQGENFDLVLTIHVLSPSRYIQAMVDIPDGFQVFYGTPRFVWTNVIAGQVLEGRTTLKALTTGLFTFKARVIPFTDLGAQEPFEVEQRVRILLREEIPPPPPPPSSGVEISLEATATRVVPGQEIIVRARITNNGTSTVTMPVPFTVDGKPIITSNITVAPGRTEIVEFKIAFSPDQTGTHTVTVGNSPPLTIYVEGPGASKTPEQFFDSNANGRLDDLEILTALDYWIKQRLVPDIGVLSELQILALLDRWIKGTPIAGK